MQKQIAKKFTVLFITSMLYCFLSFVLHIFLSQRMQEGLLAASATNLIVSIYFLWVNPKNTWKLSFVPVLFIIGVFIAIFGFHETYTIGKFLRDCGSVAFIINCFILAFQAMLAPDNQKSPS